MDRAHIACIKTGKLVVDNRLGVLVGDILRLLVAEILTEPDIEEALVGREGLVCLLIGFMRLRNLSGRDIRQLAYAAHQLCRLQQIAELVAKEIFANSAMHILYVGSDERVAALHMVVEEGERRAEREAV